MQSIIAFIRKLFGVDHNEQNSGNMDPPRLPIAQDEHAYEFGKLDTEISPKKKQLRRVQRVYIHYNGLLNHSGAQEVYIHYGFNSWKKGTTRTLKMNQTESGEFVAELPTSGNTEINYCFRDASDNWDNNHGYNWSLPLILK